MDCRHGPAGEASPPRPPVPDKAGRLTLPVPRRTPPRQGSGQVGATTDDGKRNGRHASTGRPRTETGDPNTPHPGFDG
ncbi:hypothetical protein GCM10009716_16260 [Streptomyces sodiiphilus]|uniref:Uncharacterized protein n=1 Tax=Streptomyces sodiiphilus TaxID=226217 RepID=A0ABN2NZU1_9ACTN